MFVFSCSSGIKTNGTEKREYIMRLRKELTIIMLVINQVKNRIIAFTFQDTKMLLQNIQNVAE